MKHRTPHGFTVVELIVAIAILLAAGLLVVWQKNDIDAANRDSQRKVSVNAIHYSLEEVYYPNNGNTYPEQLRAEDLKGLSPDLLTGPNGNRIGESESSLRYEPLNCADGKCRGYTLRADLEKEADFIKDSRRN